MADNAPGGKVEFRRALAAAFLFKFFVHAALALEADTQAAYKADVPQGERGGWGGKGWWWRGGGGPEEGE